MIRIKLPTDKWRPIYERVQSYLNGNAEKIIEMIAKEQLQHVVERVKNLDRIYLCSPERVAGRLLNLDLYVYVVSYDTSSAEVKNKIIEGWNADDFKITDVVVNGGDIRVMLTLPNDLKIVLYGNYCGTIDDLATIKKEDLPIFNSIKHKYAESLLARLPDALSDAVENARSKQIDYLEEELREQREEFERRLEELKKENEKLKERITKYEEITRILKNLAVQYP